MRCLLFALASCGIATAAAADPCEAIGQDGRAPSHLRYGARFVGPVVHVIDGDSLCVAIGEGPSNWVEVRLSDYDAIELAAPGGASAKAALERVALGREASCVASMVTYDRIAARCVIGGVAIGNSLRAAGGVEGGNGRAPVRPVTRGLDPVPSAAGGAPFRSCAEARAAGAAPVFRGSAGYNPNLDGDGDGIACEPYRGR